ncbi:MAG TPA: hypothetical protein VGR20_03890 [Acidimicrobiia bacterium]|jgi:hypothetical protein|nr:hypothetical protein [Acidimicrobiia bacterium]
MNLGNWMRLAWDRAAAVILIAVGAVALLLGYVGVSGEAFPAKQLPYLISGGIAGVFILGVGALCWLSADMRDEWTKLDRIEGALNRLADTGLTDPDALRRAAATNGTANLVESAS